MVLHTWGQTLQLHPHVHVILPGGGLDRRRPVEGVSPGLLFARQGAQPRVSRQAAGAAAPRARVGRAALDRRAESPTQPAAFVAFLQPLYEAEWNVYAKPPAGSASKC